MFSILKTVQGSFNQSDIRFGETAGVQCATNSLFCICWSKIREVGRWSSYDLDFTLTNGDVIYKTLLYGPGSISYICHLSVTDLPQSIEVNDSHIEIEFLQNMTGELSLNRDDGFLVTLFYSTNRIGNGFLLFINGFTIGILYGTGQNTYWLFDSHSRSQQGFPVPDGTSILLQFPRLNEIEEYLRAVYLLPDRHCTFFQIQFVKVTISDYDKNNIREYFHSMLQRQRMQDTFSEIRGTPKHEQIKKQNREKYAKISGTLKHKKLKQKKQHENSTRKKNKSRKCKINLFKKDVQQGPFYICVVCHRSLYNRSVILYDESKYDNKFWHIIVEVCSFDEKLYICKTCDGKLRKKRIPCQSVSNKLKSVSLPDHLKDIRRLERVITSKRLLFKKITIMPKGQTPKLKGAICNVPIDNIDLTSTLPRAADSNGLVLVKLKRKLEYRGHVYFESVRPSTVYNFLHYLKENNHLYRDINILPENIPQNLMRLTDDNIESDILEHLIKNQDEELPIEVELNSDNFEFEQGNPLDAFRIATNETVLISNFTQPQEVQENIINVAPGEGQSPLPIMSDEYCEELAHPHLFPTGQFGYKVKREIPLSPVKYFNQRLLNYNQKFASDSDYIFFAHSVLLQIHLNSQINIAMKKVSSNALSAGMLSNNFKDTVKQFIASDQAFSFMTDIKGTPAYWKKFLHEVLSMVKQLGAPTFFLTLSCADLRWNELVSIISKLNGHEISDAEMSNLTYHERCELLNSNPILLARHFQFRVETFFKYHVLDGALGKTKYYAIRVEFQVRGSPHIHSFIWIENSPQLTTDNQSAYINFVENIVSATIPDHHQDPELFELVKTFQLHRHSKTCVKYKNKQCRFNFGKFFTEHSIIAEPLPDTMLPEEKTELFCWRTKLLKKVKAYVNVELNPGKKNFFDHTREDFEACKDIEKILEELEISLKDYEKALSISEDSDFHLHLKRPPNSCFVNNYFKDGLMAWEANLDIQPVFNQYNKAITYMCAYLSKTEDECSHAMNQVLREAYENRKDIYEQMRDIANTYSAKRELSVQEAVYHIMPELWLRKVFPAVLFANSNLPDKRYRICLSEEEIKALPEDSTEIFKRNIVDRYIDRPNKTFMRGKYQELDDFCLAEFLRYYYLTPKPFENDCQPNQFSDEFIEVNHFASGYHKHIPLMSSSEKLCCRKVPYILRYHVPNRNKYPERYAHHLLFMFYPFRSETSLLSRELNTYIDKLNEPGVLQVINMNKARIEPYTELVDEAFTRFRNDLALSSNCFGQQENDDVIEQLQEVLSDNDNEIVNPNQEIILPTADHNNIVLSDDEISARIRSLNSQQREVFNVVHRWARNYVKNLACKVPQTIDPFHLFLTGGAGVGKSHLLTTIYQAVSKVLMYRGGELDKKRISVLSHTGVAAVNVDGTTIHSGLGIQIRGKLFPLNDRIRSSLRQKFSNIQLVMIDEISMVSSKLFRDIDLRLREIFNCDSPFGGKPVIVCGDLFQLPPVKGKPVYDLNVETLQGVLNLELWRMFRMAELTEVMRQRGDDEFIGILNKIRVGEIDEHSENVLRLRFVNSENSDYPLNELHIFAENEPANIHNEKMLNRISDPKVEIPAADEFPKESQIVQADLRVLESGKLCDTGGLPSLLLTKVGARVMIIKNIDLEDRLINGQIGTVMQLKFRGSSVITIYLKLDDERAGVKSMRSDPIARENAWVPIEKAETTFSTRTKAANAPVIRRTQFPLMLAWACTCHKVQSLSIPKIVVSFTLNRQRNFNPGQMYVALSRVTGINGLYLVGKYSRSAIKVNLAAKKEYERLRVESSFKPLKVFQNSENCLTVTLLNTRSLKKHAIDIQFDSQLMNSDIICLTETQVSYGDDVSPIDQLLQQFHMEYNISSTSKFRSLAFCLSQDISLTGHEKDDGYSILTCKKVTYSESNLKIALLYRSPSSQLGTFYDTISYVASERKADIILGDFNIDGFGTGDTSLQDILHSYELIVNQPTHLSGSLLDHVYIKRALFNNSRISTVIKNVYFSDHDAVCFEIAPSLTPIYN